MDKKDLMVLGGMPVIGTLTGLGLSFTALSPLIVGGIIGSIALACCTGVSIVGLLYQFFKKDPIKDPIKDNKGATLFLVIATLASAAIGIGLAAAATAIFPGAMLGMGSAALAGAAIGVIAPVAGVFAALAILLVAEKVNEHIISPIVERIFSSENKGY